MNTSMSLDNQLLATKFFFPAVTRKLISRPRLGNLLEKAFYYPLTLVSAPAGFGKTSLLAAWGRSLSASVPRLSWLSLEEEDNEPRLFWTYVLTAFNRQQPERFTPLLKSLQSPQAPPLNYVLTMLINLLGESEQDIVLILDDYQVITEQHIHSTLSYLVDHVPAKVHLILSTRADPPLPLSRWRARQRVLEVRADQLRCTAEETATFFKDAMGIELSGETVQEIATRTEGWLVGLQLLSLSLRGQADPSALLKEISGDQRYILGFLTQEVLRQQAPEVQVFLLSTCILEQLSASLCDAVTQQSNCRQLLQQIEKANLFVVSLDLKQQWYRYHALFAQALHHQLKRTFPDLVPQLHQRASLWYAQHQQTTQATLHAFAAREWERAADLIEQQLFPLLSQTWGVSRHALAAFQQWLEQLPVEVMHTRPQLCLASALLLFQMAPYPVLEGWLDVAEAALTTLLTIQAQTDGSSPLPASRMGLEQENMLGMVVGLRAVLKTYGKEGQAALPLCQQALDLLAADNVIIRALVFWTQCLAYYTSAANDAVAAVEKGLQAVSLACATGQTTLTIAMMGTAATYMVGAGRLREASQLSQQARALGTQAGGLVLPEVGSPLLLQAEVLCEHNELDAALSLTREALSLCSQSESMVSLVYALHGYAVLLHILLSCGNTSEAYITIQNFEYMKKQVNQLIYSAEHSDHATIDRVRLWLACGELDRAREWAKQSKITEQEVTAFGLERQEVARVRIFLAQHQPMQALERLDSILQRAATGQRWGHVIEMRILQALAYQMDDQVPQALAALAEAVCLGEPEGYIRSFVDEGPVVEALCYQLRQQERRHGTTPYLDRLLAAFQQEHRACVQAEEQAGAQGLAEPLSGREREVLHLLARGASNQQIAQELVIVVDTVKRHVTHIFTKLGVRNRVQAIRQAQALGLLGED
jgi:LuxR family transcriptional regulator, maltose regulon positive regulatory protein